MNYEFWPCQQMRVEDLASQLESSATPVREALARLAGEGIIETVANRGYFAKPLSVQDIGWSIDLLFILLISVVSNANLPQDWREACTLVEHSTSQVDPSENSIMLAIATMAGNRALAERISHVLDTTLYVRSVALDDHTFRSKIEDGLAQATAQLERGDSAAAQESLCLMKKAICSQLPDAVKECQRRLVSKMSNQGLNHVAK